MGYGSYRASDWVKLKESRGISASSGAEQIFRGNELQDKYNPRFIDMRESCDSEDSPQSTPIILAFDVTGSMGYLAAEIAKHSLNETITQIYDKNPVTNPHVMCAAITEPRRSGGLQVTQFEADIRVVEQLLELKVGFGGNRYSYDSLVWYFAAKHTKIDCFDKRGKKGFLFVIGDEVCGAQQGEKLDASSIREIFGDDTHESVSLASAAAMAAKKYEIFHIVTGESYHMQEAKKTWDAFLPGRTACVPGPQISCLSEVIISILQICSGMDRGSVIRQWDGETQSVVATAVETIRTDAPVPSTRPSYMPEPRKPQKITPPAPARNPSRPADTKAQTGGTPKKKGFFARLFSKDNANK